MSASRNVFWVLKTRSLFSYREVDRDSDGRISFKEFECAMKHGQDEVSPLYFAWSMLSGEKTKWKLLDLKLFKNQWNFICFSQHFKNFDCKCSSEEQPLKLYCWQVGCINLHVYVCIEYLKYLKTLLIPSHPS